MNQPEVDAAEIEAEMARDPLSHALLRNAQLTVLLRKAYARIQELEHQPTEGA